jgi:hypothetical protein
MAGAPHYAAQVGAEALNGLLDDHVGLGWSVLLAKT